MLKPDFKKGVQASSWADSHCRDRPLSSMEEVDEAEEEEQVEEREEEEKMDDKDL